MERQVYLNQIPWEEALEKWLSALGYPVTPAEEIPVGMACGRVTAQAVLARRSSPHYPASAMDGIATDSGLTAGASESSPVELARGQAVPVNTGEPIPPGCDAVIMIEDVRETADGWEIIAPAVPWQHVRPVGEDLVVGDLVLPQGHLIKPFDLGALIAGGVTSVPVRRRPAVAIIPTGTELVDIVAEPSRDLAPGNVVEYNSYVLSGLIEEWGGEARREPPCRDVLEEVREAVRRASEKADVVLVNAGSSAGSRDYTVHALRELGEVVVHGLAIKPGKPAILAVAGGKPVLGVPGYPVSAALVADLLLKPLLAKLMSGAVPPRERAQATLSKKVVSPPGVEEFIRVRMGDVGGRLLANPVSRGAGLITSLVKADGILRVPRLSQGFAAGQPVEVELLRSRESLRKSVIVAGSHDPILDFLGDLLSQKDPGWSLSVAPVGSLGGLLALARGEAHLAGSHLLDESTGEYNFPFLGQYLPGRPVTVVNLVYREQGFMVPPGNPKGIRGFEDLARPELLYINRQRGAGTRILLDIELSRRGIDPTAVRGYDREEFTHTGVAAAVAGGTADVGLGLFSAARALGLDFVPVTRERYDLIIPDEYLESGPVQRVLDVVRSLEFRSLAQSLGGYDASLAGEILARPYERGE